MYSSGACPMYSMLPVQFQPSSHYKSPQLVNILTFKNFYFYLNEFNETAALKLCDHIAPNCKFQY